MRIKYIHILNKKEIDRVCDNERVRLLFDKIRFRYYITQFSVRSKKSVASFLLEIKYLITPLFLFTFIMKLVDL